MNAEERKKMKALEKSKDKYKKKSIAGTRQKRLLKLRLKETKCSRDKHRKKCVILEEENHKLEEENKELEREKLELQNFISNNRERLSKNKDKIFYLNFIAIQMVVQYMISLRGVQKLLSNPEFFSINREKMVSYVTIREWCIRYGLYLLLNVRKIEEKWICILDMTVQIGRAKALIILRLPQSKIKENRAIIHTDVDVVSIKISNTFKHQDIKNALTEVFEKIGTPIQIISDGGSELNKGINELINEKYQEIHYTRDITHKLANYLKNEHKDSKMFIKFANWIKTFRQKVQQTEYSVYIPPAFRNKSRFLNLAKIYEWALAMQDWLKYLKTLKSKENKLKYKKTALIFKGLNKFRKYLLKSYNKMLSFNNIMKQIKLNGINEKTVKNCKLWLDYLPNKDPVKEEISKWLDDEYEYSKKISCSTLGSSDIIESIFGKYKEIIDVNSSSHINDSILLIPCFCSNIEYETVEKAFTTVKVKDVKKWKKDNLEKHNFIIKRKILNRHRKRYKNKVKKIEEKSSK